MFIHGIQLVLKVHKTLILDLISFLLETYKVTIKALTITCFINYNCKEDYNDYVHLLAK